ncbi:MAG: efflux RND transporter permease subunit [Candidatus Aminicenantes bacterium]|nr:efflux RND transporter permease subunit [Candidatus Aminicenantes bacterium]
MKIKSKFEITTKRPVAIVMIVLGIAVFGYVSYKRLSWDLMPEISYPSFTVRTEYPGAAPEEVENVVSRPLEEQLSLIKNLVSVTSVSRPEQSDIVLEFTWDANLDRAAQEIREKLDQVYLDRAVERPMILRYDPSLDPVLRIGIVSEIPLIDLRVMVEDEIARELEALPGVAAARVKGGFEKEILIKLDEKLLASTQITFNAITTRLAQENVNLAGGNIKEGETEYIVRTLNEFRSVKEIGDIIIAKKDTVLVRLKDIAEIDYSHKERKVITRVNRLESIEIDIYKEADSNIVDVSNRVKERLFGTPAQQRFVKALKEGKIKPARPGPGRDPMLEKRMTNFLVYRLSSEGKQIDYNILADQAIFIENSINEVKNTAIIGGILATLVLYLFLQHFPTTVIVAVAIPLSIIAAFAPLNLFKVSLNIMSLGGLALGIGMLVDNSIVVMESIFRCREEGDGWVESAVRGAHEVGSAVIASTLTTIAVFFPIVFVEGIAGQIFGDLSLAVVFSLLASLMVSLFFIPMLASRKFKKGPGLATKRFAFTFETQRSLKYYLYIPIEILKSLFILTFNMLLVGFLFLLPFFLVIVLPIILTVVLLKAVGFAGLIPIAAIVALLLFFRLSSAAGFLKAYLRLIERVNERFSKKALWDDFLSLAPLKQFIASAEAPRKWYAWMFAYLYYVFRLVLAGASFLFVRVGLTFLGLGVVFFKGLGIMLLTVFVPVIKLLTLLFNKLLKAINYFYPRLLAAALKNSMQVIGVVLAIFVFTILVILPRIDSELIPEVHQGTIYVNVTFPVGTPVERNDHLLQDISRKIKQLESVNSISYYAGTTKDELREKEVGEHIGKITVMLKKSRNIQAAEETIIGSIRSILGSFTDLDYNISRPVLFTMKAPIEVLIKGYNLEQLRRVSSELYEKIAALPGLRDVQSSVKPGFPELVIEFDRMRLSHYGMNAFDVASLIKNKIEGFVATRYKEKDKRVDIRVYLKDEQRKRAKNIKNLIINPGGAIPIQLKSVARVTILSGPNEIRRVDQDRTAVISANIADINLTGAVNNIYDVIENYTLPPDFNYEISGQNKEMETSLNSLAMAMLLAIFMVYIVMASQFESFLHPFLILFTIPMALIGVIFTLYVLKIPLGITVYIGMITLVGIVVNNAIILIDYINTLRKRGIEKLEAIKQAGAIRLRPILITTLTTVLGLLPMALGMGEGTEIRTPMAVSIIAGLLSATFLTLVLIPIVYNKFSK